MANEQGTPKPGTPEQLREDLVKLFGENAAVAEVMGAVFSDPDAGGEEDTPSPADGE